MKQIPLTQGKFALVDDEDYPVLSRFSWHFILNKNPTFPYTAHKAPTSDSGKKITTNIPITAFLTINRHGKRAIPINGDYLDCRKENLKLVPYSTRKQHTRKVTEYMGKKPASKYKGVSFCSRTNASNKVMWRAYINPRVKGEVRKQIYIGTFQSEDDAARAYNEKAKEIYGEDAYQNIILD